MMKLGHFEGPMAADEAQDLPAGSRIEPDAPAGTAPEAKVALVELPAGALDTSPGTTGAQEERPVGPSEVGPGTTTSVQVDRSNVGAMAVGPGARAENKVQITAQTVIVSDKTVAIEIARIHALAPNYPDPATRALSDRLVAARLRRQRLHEIQVDTAEVDREILDLRRQIRDGGQLRAGDSLGEGRYLLLEQIGRGGFGVVWKAYDHQRSKEVAIKVLHPDQAREPSRRERFFRGARIMAGLQHPAIVRVLDPHGEDGGYLYFVMELVEGENLHEAVVGGRFRREETVPLILRVGDALAEAHARGIVHRDVKPGNILLDAARTPKLTDFDLVIAKDTTGGTRTGAMGTFPFIAPEQMKSAREVDARADVYGLAMTAVFCLHGGNLPDIALRRPESAIDSLDAIESVKQVLKRAVELNPNDRYAGAHEFGTALKWAATQDQSSLQLSRTAFADPATSNKQLRDSPAPLNSNRQYGLLIGIIGGAFVVSMSIVGDEPASTPAPVHLSPSAVSSSTPTAAAPPASSWIPLPVTPELRKAADDFMAPLFAKDFCPDDMILIRAGAFSMGSAASEGSIDERPQHMVTLDQFCIDKFEVSVDDYRKCEDHERGGLRCEPAPKSVRYDGSDRRYDQFCNAGIEDRSSHPVTTPGIS